MLDVVGLGETLEPPTRPDSTEAPNVLFFGGQVHRQLLAERASVRRVRRDHEACRARAAEPTEHANGFATVEIGDARRARRAGFEIGQLCAFPEERDVREHGARRRHMPDEAIEILLHVPVDDGGASARARESRGEASIEMSTHAEDEELRAGA